MTLERLEWQRADTAEAALATLRGRVTAYRERLLQLYTESVSVCVDDVNPVEEARGDAFAAAVNEMDALGLTEDK